MLFFSFEEWGWGVRVWLGRGSASAIRMFYSLFFFLAFSFPLSLFVYLYIHLSFPTYLSLTICLPASLSVYPSLSFSHLSLLLHHYLISVHPIHFRTNSRSTIPSLSVQRLDRMLPPKSQMTHEITHKEHSLSVILP